MDRLQVTAPSVGHACRASEPVRAVAVLFALVSAGCGGERTSFPVTSTAGSFCADVMPKVDAYLAQASAGTAPVDEAHRYGGTAVVGSIDELAGGMNTFTSPDYGATQHQQHVVLMTLLTYGPGLELRPYLARSWEVSPEGTEVTFHLRTDVYWHDGVRTDARDVAFSFTRATDPRTGFPNASMWSAYTQGEGGVEVVDDSTVVVRLRPHAEFMDPWTSMSIMPEHLLGDVPPDQLGGHPYGTQCPVGNGPFVFRTHDEQVDWVFEANPAFPRELGGRPYLDRYVYRVIPDQATLLSELLTGGIDVYLAPTPDEAERIEAASDLELLHYPFRNVVFVAWNSRRLTLSDARVRRAITMATPRQDLVDALAKGYGVIAHGRIPPFHWAYDPSYRGVLRHDPAGARALLAEAGWIDRDGDGVRESADGVPLSISIKYNSGSRPRAQIAQIMQAALAEVGVDVRPEVVEWGTLVSQLTDVEARDFDGVVLAFLTDFRIDDTDLFSSSSADRPYGWSGTRIPKLDTLMDRLVGAVDRDRARRLWGEYERVLEEEQPYTFLYFPDRLDGVNRRLKGVVMDARGEWVGVRRWWIDPADRPQ
jgi:peptide/nickel transport system substrate-binding protein